MGTKRRSKRLEALTVALPSSSSSPPRNNKRNSATFPFSCLLASNSTISNSNQSLNQSPNPTSPHKSTSFVSGSRFTPLKLVRPPPSLLSTSHYRRGTRVCIC
ncbi:hypothetical protein VKT23_018612 [Stygiomarasmius scandens]|uniref:Uncharacterized protein n=1 Tax=Marasmiellus scandens TaxID=2682957 RepID=A0ABR1INJ1_9AGAR